METVQRGNGKEDQGRKIFLYFLMTLLSIFSTRTYLSIVITCSEWYC